MSAYVLTNFVSDLKKNVNYKEAEQKAGVDPKTWKQYARKYSLAVFNGNCVFNNGKTGFQLMSDLGIDEKEIYRPLSKFEFAVKQADASLQIVKKPSMLQCELRGTPATSGRGRKKTEIDFGQLSMELELESVDEKSDDAESENDSE